MKRIFSFFFMMTLLLTLTSACSNDDTEPEPDPGTTPGGTVDPSNPSKILVTYFSYSGNTRQLANQIAELTGGDTFEVIPITPYPADFDECVAQARRERAEGYKPPLKNRIENIDDYDVIFVGFPIWGMTISQPTLTFLTDYDFSGKTVIPFCTHAGYGRGQSFTTVANLCPNSTILEGFDIHGDNVNNARTLLTEWLQKIKMLNANVPVKITAGNTHITGYFKNTPLAKEIQSMFPLSVNMGKFGGREYYGSISTRPTATEEGQLNFENGDITYCPSNNTIAIFYAQTDRPNLTMRVIPIGKVTSDLSVFDTMDSSIRMEFDIAK